MTRVLDYAERLLIVLLSIPFIIAFAIALPAHPQFILLAASELLCVVLALVRKPGEMVVTPYAFFIAIVGTAMPLLVRPGGVALLPAGVTFALMLAGLVLSVAAKLWLNRSFGLVAANRGVKQGGPYRVVRHPMYLGYIATQAGFLLAAFSPINFLLYVSAWTFQVLRIREEEHFLMLDDRYLTFSRRVRFKLVPGLF